MEGPQLRQKMSQKLKLCPQLLQNMALLQMNVQELGEFLDKAAEENPVLERQDPPEDAFRQLARQHSWMQTASAEAPPEPGAEDAALNSRESFLRDQLDRKHLAPRLAAVCSYLVDLLDEDGFLQPEDWAHLQAIGIPASLAEQALAMLQSLDPAGIAARSLSECLLLQLRRTDHATPLLEMLVTDHLEALARQQYAALAAALHTRQAEIEAAAAVIAGLDPHPGRWEAAGRLEPVQYIRPDVYILDDAGTLTIVLNDFYLPRLSLSSSYEEMMQRTQDAATASYLRQHFQSAQDLLQGLARRSDTLQRCIDALVQNQAAFFRSPEGVLRPLTRRELAEQLEVHPSTVTRALKDKYLQCRRGTYPLGAFFSQPVGRCSPQEIQNRMIQLLREDPNRSDRLLWEALSAEGYAIARRTVTKYRQALGLPTASQRRKRLHSK